MNKVVEPPILYVGTPVVLISTLNLYGRLKTRGECQEAKASHRR
jgi:hypothetical protein